MDGNEIRELREELGVSQEELARRLQVSVSTVDRWENGLSAPTGEVVARIQRIRRLKEFQGDGRVLTLNDLMLGGGGEEMSGLPPWHPDAEGIEPGQLSLIVSPPKCGKTLTALRWAYKSCVLHELPAFYVSTHWTPTQTLRHLEAGLQGEHALDPSQPFFVFQHDGKNLTGLLEELSASMEEQRKGLATRSFVVFDWLQNLDYAGERFLQIEEKERQILRDLKTWSTQQRAFVLVIASQRGVEVCEPASFPHFFELADSISIGELKALKNRDVAYTFQDLHKGGKQVFAFRLPPSVDLGGSEPSIHPGDAPRGRRRFPIRRSD